MCLLFLFLIHNALLSLEDCIEHFFGPGIQLLQIYIYIYIYIWLSYQYEIKSKLNLIGWINAGVIGMSSTVIHDMLSTGQVKLLKIYSDWKQVIQRESVLSRGKQKHCKNSINTAFFHSTLNVWITLPVLVVSKIGNVMHITTTLHPLQKLLI